MKFSTTTLVGGGVLLFLLGLFCGSLLPSISSSMNDDLRYDHDSNERSLRRRLQYLDPRTVAFKTEAEAGGNPLNTNDNGYAAAAFPQQLQQQRQIHQLQPQQPIAFASGFDISSNNINHNQLPSTLEVATLGVETRDAHISSMCRCPTGLVPVPTANQDIKAIYQTVPKSNLLEGRNLDASVIQPPSKATGNYHKRFIHHPLQNCECREDDGRLKPTRTVDQKLKKISRQFFHDTCAGDNPVVESKTNWDQMPDFGVEDKPIFAGVLSYESPLSLNNSLHNWLDSDLFRRIAAQDVFVQLNHRSDSDDEVVNAFQRNKLNGRHPMTVTGSPEENLHSGRAVSKFCRMAEQHPSSHPNGENLLLFLEKDWIIPDGAIGKQNDQLEEIFRSAIALSGRGVPYIGLRPSTVESNPRKHWNCAAEGVPWQCANSHNHVWTSRPGVIDCSWFLRYFEPYALNTSCDHEASCNWMAASQWKNSEWVLAHLSRHKGILFENKKRLGNW